MMYELLPTNNPNVLDCPLQASIEGRNLADCELCGAMKVGVKQVPMGRAVVAACTRCVEKLGLGPKEVAPGLKIVNNTTPTTNYATKKKGKNIMLKTSKEVDQNYPTLISKARKQKGWNQATLAKRMAETVNVIKAAENGKIPTDSVVKKFEKILGITLMVDSTPEETKRVYNDNSRGMTLGDYFKQNGE